MSIPGHNCDVRSSGQACDKWSMEWTYSGATGEVTLDTATGEGLAWTDLDPRVLESTQVADGGTGITTFKFPGSRRARVAHVSIEPATPGTIGNHRHPVVCLLNALAGTGSIYISAANGGALSDPEILSRGRLVLDLEYR